MAVLNARKLSFDRLTDVADLQAVLDDSPYYDVLVEDRPVSRFAATELLRELPEGKSLDDKLVLGIYDAARPVGCVDVIRSFPESHIAYLGLLLFRGDTQGRGFGPWALNMVDEICASWGCTQLRLAVIETNHRGIAFWRREGFAELHRRPTGRGTAIIMERPNKLLQRA